MFFVVDPGEACGFMAFYPSGQVAQHLEADPYTTVEAMNEWLLRYPKTICVAERYVITMQTMKMTRQYAALETIGAMKYVAKKHGAPMLLQDRSGKSKVTREILVRLDWWKPTKDGHANDAARHAWMAFLRHAPESIVVTQGLGTVV